MRPLIAPYRPAEITFIAVLVSLLLLLPPLKGLWSANDNAWYTPYIIWLAIILLSYGLQKHLKKHAV